MTAALAFVALACFVLALIAATIAGHAIAERDEALDRMAALHAEIGHAGDDIAQMGRSNVRAWLDEVVPDAPHTIAPGRGTPQ